MPQQNAFQIGKTNPFHEALKNRTSVTGLLILTTVVISCFPKSKYLQELLCSLDLCLSTSCKSIFVGGYKWPSPTDIVER